MFTCLNLVWMEVCIRKIPVTVSPPAALLLFLNITFLWPSVMFAAFHRKFLLCLLLKASSYLASHLFRWRESSGLLEKARLVTMCCTTSLLAFSSSCGDRLCFNRRLTRVGLSRPGNMAASTFNPSGNNNSNSSCYEDIQDTSAHIFFMVIYTLVFLVSRCLLCLHDVAENKY